MAGAMGMTAAVVAPALNAAAATAAFVAALASGEDIATALKWAPINPMSVVQKMGAQAGLLTKQKLLNLLKKAPHDYEPREIAKV